MATLESIQAVVIGYLEKTVKNQLQFHIKDLLRLYMLKK